MKSISFFIKTNVVILRFTSLQPEVEKREAPERIPCFLGKSAFCFVSAAACLVFPHLLSLHPYQFITITMTTTMTFRKLRLREVKPFAQVPQLITAREGISIQICQVPEPMFFPLCYQLLSSIKGHWCSLWVAKSHSYGES